MKLTVTMFLTLDGVQQSPGAKEEDPSNGFDLGGWLVPFADEEFGRIVTEQFGGADAFLLGRKSYELMYGYWSTVTDPDDLVATKLNGQPKYVVSGTLTDPEWAHTVVVDGHLTHEVRALKELPGDELQVHGSGQLARTLHDLGLIDEYRLWIFPVVLGKGYRLFPEGSVPTGMELVSATTTKAGVSVLTLRPTGAPVSGTVDVVDGKGVNRV